MTKETILKPIANIDITTIHKERLSASEITSPQTDADISMKLVDNSGNVIMLIEVSSCTINAKDEEIYRKGCFVNRFEFVENFVNTTCWTEFLKTFITAARCQMIPVETGKYLARYQYIWAQKEIGCQCVIAEIFGLKEIKIENEFCTYMADLKN